MMKFEIFNTKPANLGLGLISLHRRPPSIVMGWPSVIMRSVTSWTKINPHARGYFFNRYINHQKNAFFLLHCQWYNSEKKVFHLKCNFEDKRTCRSLINLARCIPITIGTRALNNVLHDFGTSHNFLVNDHVVQRVGQDIIRRLRR